MGQTLSELIIVMYCMWQLQGCAQSKQTKVLAFPVDMSTLVAKLYDCAATACRQEQMYLKVHSASEPISLFLPLRGPGEESIRSAAFV